MKTCVKRNNCRRVCYEVLAAGFSDGSDVFLWSVSRLEQLARLP